MSESDSDIDWSLTTWEGNRRLRIERWLALSPEERLAAIEGALEVARHFRKMRAEGRFKYPERDG